MLKYFTNLKTILQIIKKFERATNITFMDQPLRLLNYLRH